jgi:hypothetical protein
MCNIKCIQLSNNKRSQHRHLINYLNYNKFFFLILLFVIDLPFIIGLTTIVVKIDIMFCGIKSLMVQGFDGNHGDILMSLKLLRI